MPNVINVFPLSIYQDSIRLDTDYRMRLVDTVLGMGAEPRLRQRDGVAWTGDVNGFEFLHQDERFDSLFAQLSNQVRKYVDSLGMDQEKLNFYFTRAWATISRSGEKILAHSHQQSHISLAYYLAKPAGSGGISFMDHEPANEFAPELFSRRMLNTGVIRKFQLENTFIVNLEPSEGDVFIFPSKTRHETESSGTEEPRISISADIICTIKDSAGLEFMLPDVDHWKQLT